MEVFSWLAWKILMISLGILLYGFPIIYAIWIISIIPIRIYRYIVGIVLSIFYLGFISFTIKENFANLIWNKISIPYSVFLESSNPPTKVLVSTSIERYKVLTWNPPKHFYITLENVKSHQVYRGIYVSKHCNGLELNAGEEYNISVTTYYLSNNPDNMLIQFNYLKNVFC